MAKSRVHLVTGNEEINFKHLLLENLFYYKKFIKENPLLINSDENNSLRMNHNKLIKNSDIKSFDYYTKLGFTAIEMKELYYELQKNNTPFLEIENDFSDTFILGEVKVDDMEFFDLIDYVILIMKNNVESSSYLYNYLNKLLNKMIDKKIYIIVSNIKKIEEAVSFFIKLRNEMKKLIDVTFDLNFIGFADYDVKKIVYSKEREETLIESFFEDSFHGTIKFINEKLNSLEKPYKNETFFTSLSKFNFTS